MKTIEGHDVKIFTDSIEGNAFEQVKTLLSIDVFSDMKIRIMPDVHTGAGCVIGFIINNRFAVAGEMDLSFQSSRNDNLKTLSIGPYARYVFNSGRLRFFSELAVRYRILKSNHSDVVSGYDMCLRPGVAVALSSRCSLITKFSLIDFSQQFQEGTTLSQTGLRLGTDLSVGVAYNF